MSERKEAILQLLDREWRTAREITEKEFGRTPADDVSKVTVQKYLRKLEEEGLCERMVIERHGKGRTTESIWRRVELVRELGGKV